MTPVARPQCPLFMIPFLADGPVDPLPVTEADHVRGRAGGLHKILGDRYGDFRKLLSQAFAWQCCYCESPMGAVADGEVELFRPRSFYWQLAADWRNIYLACPACNRSKAGRFPLIGEPSRAGQSYEEVIRVERPLLLDPCDTREHPDSHLAFFQDGSVAGRTVQGRATVETLALNRSGLVQARMNEALKFKLASPEEREARAVAQGPYSAVWRQMLMSNADRAFARRSEVALSEQRALDKVRTQLSTEDALGLDNYRAVARYIERVRIENFGPIRVLELDLSQSLSAQAPCFALLGENGVGKSTVLRAIALALAGKSYAKRLRLTSKKLLAPDAHRGEVRVSIVGRPDIVMTLRRSRAIEFSTDRSQSLVLAYGATRLLPKGRHKSKRGEIHAKIDNLFDPFVPLTDPEDWLATMDPSRWVEVNKILRCLLPAVDELELVQTDVGVRLRGLGDGKLGGGIRELSDGYQSMLGMAFDIMQVMYMAYDSMAEAQGVVLIDELGNHFHPAWRLRCVDSLRRAFPQIQFIFSTHDPLCLRGLVGGEVAVLRRDRLRQIYALEDLPPVSKLRVEQLLSSEHFGLHSTLDPKMEDQVREYEQLILKMDRTAEDESRLDEIVHDLTSANYLGSSRRERLALQLLDNEGEGEIPRRSSMSASVLADATVAKLRRVMREVVPRAGGSS